MYLRLIARTRHWGSGRRTGVFTAAYDLMDEGRLEPFERDALREELDWFSENLPIPRVDDERAIFWFGRGAGECIRRAWDLANLLKSQGVVIDLLTT